MSDPNRYAHSNKGWGRDDEAPAPRRRVRKHPADPQHDEPRPHPRRRHRLFNGLRNLLALIGLGTVIWLAARYAVIPLLVMMEGVMP